MANIKFENVNKNFDDGKTIINKLNLDIKDGEFVVLLGPTGAGKTVILRMISGLDEISDGSLYIGDKVVNTLQPKDRNIAMIFQTHQLMPTMSVYDNIAFGLKLRKMSASDINVRVREMARIMGLGDGLGKKPKMLSAIERQRVAFARAVVREPNVYLFDDPLTGLDDVLTRNVRSDLIKLQYRVNGTFVLATRDQIDAMTLATKIAVVNGGVIEQYDTPKNIYEHPKTVFVATYVGSPSINVCPATLVCEEGKTFVQIGETKVELSDEVASKINDKDSYLSGTKQLTVAVRPENVSFDETSTLKAVVDTVENYGSHKIVLLKFNDKTFRDWSVLTDSDAEFAVGSEVGIKINQEKLHLFDRETELTIVD